MFRDNKPKFAFSQSAISAARSASSARLVIVLVLVVLIGAGRCGPPE